MKENYLKKSFLLIIFFTTFSQSNRISYISKIFALPNVFSSVPVESWEEGFETYSKQLIAVTRITNL